MLKVKPQCIEVLEIGVTKMLTLPPEHGSDKTIPVSVTLIDSNHIKGSVMFHFEGKNIVFYSVFFKRLLTNYFLFFTYH